MKTTLFLCLLLVFSASLFAQKGLKSIVDARSGALFEIPADNRRSLVERTNLYIHYLKKHDVEKLYDLVTERKKKGLSREEFVRTGKIVVEGEILFFKIERVIKADENDYIDEPKPEHGEGYKWVMTGCAKRRENGKVAKYRMGFDVWLRNGQWYFDRGGTMLGEGGYQECK